MLKAGRTQEEAEAYGLSEERKFIDNETAIIHLDYLPHMVAKRQEFRERYGLYLLETLKNPYEIWLTDFDDGLRKQ